MRVHQHQRQIPAADQCIVEFQVRQRATHHASLRDQVTHLQLLLSQRLGLALPEAQGGCV